VAVKYIVNYFSTTASALRIFKFQSIKFFGMKQITLATFKT